MAGETVIRPRPGPGFVPAGTRLSGIYEIDSPIARGGMGEIYRGHAILTGEAVAIKLIRTDMADHPSALSLFTKEASALNRLHHEAIVRYFVFTVDPGLQRHYLAMEFVEGISLKDLLKRGALSVTDTLKVAGRVASGLQAAHEREIIHRDVSPDNIIIQDNNLAHARIIDFGIARSTRVGDQSVIGGGFAGKEQYAAPEQLGLYGGEVTAQSDIYSLGLVLAECLRGNPIDMGGSQVQIIEKRRQVPDISDLDPAIRPLIAWMLQPNPADRPASMAEVVAWSPRMVASSRQVAPPKLRIGETPLEDASGGASKRALAAALGGIMIVVAGGAGIYAINKKSPDKPIEKPVQPPVGPVVEDLNRPSINVPRPSDLPKPPDNPIKTTQDTPSTPTTPSVPNRPTSPTQPIDPVDKAVNFVRNYKGGDCFLATPTDITPTSAKIDGFANVVKQFEPFDAAFTKELGYDADIVVRQITQPQCPALAFLSQLRSDFRVSPRFVVPVGDTMKSGQVLEGSIESRAPSVQLLIVDDTGQVHDISSQLKAVGDRRTFAVKLLGSSSGPTGQPMILIAIATSEAVGSFKSNRPQLAAQVFPAATSELARLPAPPGTAVKYVKMQ